MSAVIVLHRNRRVLSILMWIVFWVYFKVQFPGNTYAQVLAPGNFASLMRSSFPCLSSFSYLHFPVSRH